MCFGNIGVCAQLQFLLKMASQRSSCPVSVSAQDGIEELIVPSFSFCSRWHRRAHRAQFQFPLKVASKRSERPMRAPPRLSAVSPSLPPKQCHCLCSTCACSEGLLCDSRGLCLRCNFRAGQSKDKVENVFDLYNSFEREKQTDVAILGFSKTSDAVPHKKLLHKLSLYGITGPLHAWLSNFLTQRSMRVVIEGAFSESTTVDSGVPQGTVLGPILFLCHINDLPSSVSSEVHPFADDCLLCREINTFKDLFTLHQDLKQLEAWADTWGMRFSASKCYIISINEKSNFRYTLKSTILKHVTNNPYLGIFFSQDLKWGDHIAKICRKANSTAGFLKRNLRNCPSGCKLNAYLSLVLSVLEYGSTLRDPYLQQDINKLEQVQRKAARFVSGDYKSRTPGSMQKLLQKLDQLPLQVRCQQLRLTFLFKVVEGMVPAMPPEHFFTFSKPGTNIRPK